MCTDILSSMDHCERTPTLKNDIKDMRDKREK